MLLLTWADEKYNTQKNPCVVFVTQENPGIFHRPKKIPFGQNVRPKKILRTPPSLKFVSGAPGVEWLLTSECVFNPLNPDISIFPPPWLSFQFPKVLMKRISLTTKTLSNSPSFCIYLQSRPLIFMDHSFFSYKRCVLLHSVALGGNIVFGVCFLSQPVRWIIGHFKKHLNIITRVSTVSLPLALIIHKPRPIQGLLEVKKKNQALKN